MAYRLLCRSPQYELRDLATHVRHMQHEGRAGKRKRVKLFKEKLANAPQKNIPEKPQIDNGQWTHLMSEIQVFNMFKLLCSKGIFWLDLNLLLTI